MRRKKAEKYFTTPLTTEVNNDILLSLLEMKGERNGIF